ETVIGFMAALQDFERESEPNRRPGAEMASRHYAGLEKWIAGHPASGNLVAEIDGAIAGWLLFGVEEEQGFMVPEFARLTGWISDIWVEPPQRGSGIAGALIAEAERRFAAHGIRRVHIAAVVANHRAIAFYERLGYAPYELSLGKTL
ncbi:MAG: GNAT family N-acetyltransferase, partial [Pseudomonadota bacterium]